MKIIDKIMMFSMPVDDMPKVKEFYEGILGFKVVQDFRIDDKNWWVSLEIPDSNGTSLTLTTSYGEMKPGSMNIYLSTSDIQTAHKDLKVKNPEVSDIGTDLYGPSSGVDWFRISDPEGNQLTIVASQWGPGHR